MEFDRRTRYASREGAATHDVPAPGRQTLTQGMVQMHPATAPVAATTTPPPLPVSSDPRPTLQMLFGRRPDDAPARAEPPRTPDATGIPASVRAKMEAALGADFSDVRVHPDSARAVELGARAFTQGSDIHVAPGQWAPETPQGQELLGHELGHVLQQRAGRVQATAQVKGVDLNDDTALEADADAMGARAARGDSAPQRQPANGTGPSDASTPVQRQPSSSSPVQRMISFAKYEELFRKIVFEIPKEAEQRVLDDWLKQSSEEQWDQLSIEEQVKKAAPFKAALLEYIAEAERHAEEAKTSSTYYSILKKKAYEVAMKLHEMSEEIGPSQLQQVSTFRNLPESSRALILSSSNDTQALTRFGKTRAQLGQWALLNEDIRSEDESYGSRFDIMDTLATVLLPFRQQIKELIPQARLKYRGSLVRGLKGYPKGGVKVNPNAYDCDAFIEVPSEFWLEMRKSGARGVERDPMTGEETGQVEIRGYEPLDQITFKNEERAGVFPGILEKLKLIEQQAQVEITHAQKDGRLKGYKYEDTTIDFEFFIRPVYNSASTFFDGNPYLFGQVAMRGYPAIERSLEPTVVPEFAKKQDRPESRALLAPYVQVFGSTGLIMPEYQVVIGKHGWYLETAELMQWRIMKRELDSKLQKTKFSRRALPGYSSPLPDFERPYAGARRSNELVDPHRDQMYDLIAQPEILHHDMDLTKLNLTMSSIKLFDMVTNTLTLKNPEKIPFIDNEWDRLLAELERLSQKFPDLIGSPIGDKWIGLLERVLTKLHEAIELRDEHGGSKHIVRDHSKERAKKKEVMDGVET